MVSNLTKATFITIFFLFSAKAGAGELVLKVASDKQDSPFNCDQANHHFDFETISLKNAIDLLSCGNFEKYKKAVDVRLEVAAGLYRLNAPLYLNWGTSKHQGSLAIIGPNDQKAVLSGGRQILQFRKITDSTILARLSMPAQQNVLFANVREAGLGDLSPRRERGFSRSIVPVSTEVFFNKKVMKVARWPNSGWASIGIKSVSTDLQTVRFGVKGRDLKDWAAENEMMATGYFFYEWAEESIPIASVDPGQGEIVLSKPGPRFGIRENMKVRVENALSELDEPGEWVLNSEKEQIYFWPPQPVQDNLVELSVLDNLLVIRDSKNVKISNLTFEQARGNAVMIFESENVVLERSLIRNTGNRGVVVGGGRNSGVTSTVIEDVGEGGVSLQGGDRSTLRPANLFVKDSQIRRFSRLSSTYRPAVQIAGVGNRAEGNTISESPHCAILFSGNDHTIAFNDISNVVSDSNDAGAIYTGRDWSARGTVIEGNFLHDIGGSKTKLPGVMGIYLDDQASGIVIRGNIFSRVQQPVFIGGGRDNIVINNLFYRSSPAIHLDARGLTWQRERTLDETWVLQKRLQSVPYRQPPYSERYPNLATIISDDLGAPKYNVVRHNLLVDSVAFDIAKEARSGIMLDGNLIETDDVFHERMDPKKRNIPADFRLKNIPGFEGRFRPLEIGKMAH